MMMKILLQCVTHGCFQKVSQKFQKVSFFKILCPPGRNAARGNACKIPKVSFFKILCPPGRNVARGNACKIPKVPFFKNFCPPGRNAARGNACKIHGQYMDDPSIGVNLGLIWNRFGIDLGSIWDRFGIDLGSIWGRSGVDLGSIWGRSGVDLGSIWDQFEGISDQRSGKNENIGEILNLRKFENYFSWNRG